MRAAVENRFVSVAGARLAPPPVSGRSQGTYQASLDARITPGWAESADLGTSEIAPAFDDLCRVDNTYGTKGTHLASFEEQVQTAIAAHGMWKARLRQAIASGTSEFKVDTVRRDDQCDFGRWLHGEARRVHGNDPQFEVVRSLHAGFHAEAARVLSHAIAGTRKEAEASMAIGGQFSHVSASLIAALSRWRSAAAA